MECLKLWKTINCRWNQSSSEYISVASDSCFDCPFTCSFGRLSNWKLRHKLILDHVFHWSHNITLIEICFLLVYSLYPYKVMYAYDNWKILTREIIYCHHQVLEGLMRTCFLKLIALGKYVRDSFTVHPFLYMCL